MIILILIPILILFFQANECEQAMRNVRATVEWKNKLLRILILILFFPSQRLQRRASKTTTALLLLLLFIYLSRGQRRPPVSCLVRFPQTLYCYSPAAHFCCANLPQLKMHLLLCLRIYRPASKRPTGKNKKQNMSMIKPQIGGFIPPASKSQRPRRRGPPG